MLYENMELMEAQEGLTLYNIYIMMYLKKYFETLIGQGLGSVENEFVYTIGKLFVSFGVIGVMLLLGWVLYLFLNV